MADYLDVMSKQTTNIRNMAYILAEISGGFYVTGNEKLGDELRDMADDMIKAQKLINDVVGEEINRSLAQSEQSAMNTVKACLNMTLLQAEV